MGYTFFLLFMILLYIRPAELFPSLASNPVVSNSILIASSIALVSCLISVVNKQKNCFDDPQTYLLLIFWLIICISFFLGVGWLSGTLTAAYSFGISVAGYLLAAYLLDSYQRLRCFIGLLLVLTVLLAVQGVLQYHFDIGFGKQTAFRQKLYDSTGAPVTAPTGAQDGDEHPAIEKRIRGLGFFADPNDLTLALIVAIPFLMSVLLGHARFAARLFSIGGLAFICYAIMLTRSRGGMLAAAATFAFYFRKRLSRSKQIFALAMLLALFPLITVTQRQFSITESSAANRIEAWSEGLTFFKQNPIFGIGYKQFAEHHEITAHNSFVLCFTETGLVGYFFWLAVLFITYRDLSRIQQCNYVEDGDGGRTVTPYARSLQAALVGFLVGSFFLSRTYLVILYILIGLAVALLALAKENAVDSTDLGREPFVVKTLALEMASIAFIYFSVVSSHLLFLR